MVEIVEFDSNGRTSLTSPSTLNEERKDNKTLGEVSFFLAW